MTSASALRGRGDGPKAKVLISCVSSTVIGRGGLQVT